MATGDAPYAFASVSPNTVVTPSSALRIFRNCTAYCPNSLSAEGGRELSAATTLLYSATAAGRLTGDGGDEHFGGYRRYLWHLNEERMRSALPLGVRPTGGGVSTYQREVDAAVLQHVQALRVGHAAQAPGQQPGCLVAVGLSAGIAHALVELLNCFVAGLFSLGCLVHGALRLRC